MKRLLFGAVAASLVGCSQSPPGELMMAVDTNLAIPKDIDEVEIHIFSPGGTLLQRAYPVGPDGTRLPGTLGILKPNDPKAPVTMRVKAKQLGQYRIVAEAVSVVPETRTARVRLPVDWLCDGFVQSDGEDGAVSNCGDGKTCVAGECVDDHVNEPDLPDFDPGAVFGGGTGSGDGDCFDTQSCFEKAMYVTPDASCAIAVPTLNNVNVAIRSQGEGICGSAGCLIPLDQDPTTGWKDGGGKVELKKGVCDKLKAGKAIDIAISTECPTKTPSLPTCGPWSSSGASKTPSQTGPVVLASTQNHPVALAVGTKFVFWANGGDFGKSNGNIQRVLLGGGAPFELQGKLDSPQDLAFRTNGSSSFVTWTAAGLTGNLDGSVVDFDLTHSMATTTLTNVAAPAGVTSTGNEFFYTSFGDGKIHQVQNGTDKALPFAKQNYPVRIRVDAAGTTLFWLNEGTLGQGDGEIVIAKLGASPIVLGSQETPRAIAIDDAFVYWATFTAPAGEIHRASVDGTNLKVLVKGLNFPSAVAVDDTRIYWTTLGDGSVWMAPKDGSGMPTRLAQEQSRPNAIAVSASTIYWANAGPSNSAGGSIVSLDKPK